MDWPPQNTGLFAPPSCAICPPNPALVEWRYRGQTIYLQGLPNSVPGLAAGRVFKRLTYSGGVRWDLYGYSSECSDYIGADTFDASGSLVVTPDPLHGMNMAVTGGVTTTIVYSDGTVESGESQNWVTYLGLFPFDQSYFDNEFGDTVYTKAGNGQCIVGGAGGTDVRTSGTVTITLSDEETQAMTLARYLASPPGWSDWMESGVPAFYSPTGTSSNLVYFEYYEQEWRVTKTGLLPNTSYDVAMELWRAPVPYIGEPLAFYATQIETGTTDSSGVLIVTGKTPNDLGYTTDARGPAVITEHP